MCHSHICHRASERLSANAPLGRCGAHRQAPHRQTPGWRALFKSTGSVEVRSQLASRSSIHNQQNRRNSIFFSLKHESGSEDVNMVYLVSKQSQRATLDANNKTKKTVNGYKAGSQWSSPTLKQQRPHARVVLLFLRCGVGLNPVTPSSLKKILESVPLPRMVRSGPVCENSVPLTLPTITRAQTYGLDNGI